jgi:hypothetical protein
VVELYICCHGCLKNQSFVQKCCGSSLIDESKCSLEVNICVVVWLGVISIYCHGSLRIEVSFAHVIVEVV